MNTFSFSLIAFNYNKKNSSFLENQQCFYLVFLDLVIQLVEGNTLEKKMELQNGRLPEKNKCHADF